MNNIINKILFFSNWTDKLESSIFILFKNDINFFKKI